MDIFNRKLVTELVEALNEHRRLLDSEKIESSDRIIELEASELALMVKIRDMDQLIFSMSQCSSWDQMQPIFAKLKTSTDKRMIDESNRIKQVLIPEMQKAYRQPEEVPQYNWTQQQTTSDFKLIADTSKPKRGTFE